MMSGSTVAVGKTVVFQTEPVRDRIPIQHDLSPMAVLWVVAARPSALILFSFM
jgi:hypothetical protein